MARKPRIHLPGGLYHVMLRGNGGQSVFPSDNDRYRLFLLLQEGTVRFGYRIHAFCLMTNHLHLAVQVGEIPLSRAMHNVSFRFTNWINRSQQRTGHLFQGRFKALLVDQDSYLLELVRYIHLNPVRAGLVENPGDYRWSSHRAYLAEEFYPWLTTNWVLGQLGSLEDEARSQFAAFVEDGINREHRMELQKGEVDNRVIGDDDFVGKALSSVGLPNARRPSLETLVNLVCRYYSVTLPKLRSPGQRRLMSEARAALGWLALETGAGTLTDVGEITARDAGTISSAVRRLIHRSERDLVISERMSEMKREVANLRA
jgi:putative transposase